jgi:hypothetical protein
MGLGVWKESAEPVQITTEGERPSELHYVLKVDARAEKADPSTMQYDGVVNDFHGFVGEVTYLNDQPALTTTKFLPGATYVSWNVQRLRQLLDKEVSLKRGCINSSMLTWP